MWLATALLSLSNGAQCNKTCSQITASTTCNFNVMSKSDLTVGGGIEGSVWVGGNLVNTLKTSFDYHNEAVPRPDQYSVVVYGLSRIKKRSPLNMEQSKLGDPM